MDSLAVIADIRRGLGFDLQLDNPQATLAIDNLSHNLERACQNLSEELYTKSTHFVLEFIQNAEDNTYLAGVIPTLELKLEKAEMIITSNEIGFTEQNVRAICGIGRSTKTDRTQGYIGEKGIGFKSVFTVADSVRIVSGRYAFMFNKEDKLGMIVPISLPLEREQPGTRFHLQLSPRVQRRELVSRLRDVKPSLLLFLHKIRCLKTETDSRIIELRKRPVKDGITRIERREGGIERGSVDYVIVTHRVGTFPRESKRNGVISTNIVLAFPVTTSREEPIVHEQDVHAFLALRAFGFSFIIQADFLTASNREDILVDLPWNQVLRNGIAPAFVLAVDTLRSRPALRYTWLRFMPDIDQVADEFFQPVCEVVLTKLQNTSVVLDEDEVSRLPSQVIIVPWSYQDGDEYPLIPNGYIKSKYYLSPFYDTRRDGAHLRKLGVMDMSQSQFLDGLLSMQEDGALFIQTGTWWDKVCSVLCQMTDTRSRGIIRSLKLVPLADRTWVPVTTSNVYFASESSLTDVPQDLEIRFTKSLHTTSHRYKLLHDYGIKEADAEQIARELRTLHSRYYIDEPHRSALPSHAWFLFVHRSEVAHLDVTLKVISETNDVVRASEVYMDHPSHSSLPLSGCLRRYGATFLHPDYYDSLPGNASLQQQREWMDWLFCVLGVNIAPKISYSALSPELREFLQTTDTSSLLAFLREYAPDMGSDVGVAPGAERELRQVNVVTMPGGAVCPLEATYIRRHSLTQFEDLPFLPISDPNDCRWDFLTQLGVSAQVDSSFYVKRLTQLQERSNMDQGDPYYQSEENILFEVTECYKQLETRFYDDGNDAEIRSAFQTNPIIYIPSQSRPDAEVRSPIWTSLDGAVWQGPKSMRLKVALSLTYPMLQTFFRQKLKVADCPFDIYLRELRAIAQDHDGKPLSERVHLQVHDVLYDLNLVATEMQKSTPPRRDSWLYTLSQLAFIPVRSTWDPDSADQEVRLQSLKTKFYIPDLNKHFATLFDGDVPMLTFPPRGSRGKMEHLHSLFKTEWFSSARFLESEVKVEVLRDDIIFDPDVQLSDEYRSRMAYFSRIFNDSTDINAARSFLRKLYDIGVYQADADTIKHTYILDGIVRTEESPLAVDLSTNRCMILIGRTCGRNEWDALVSLALARLFPGVTAKDVLILLTAALRTLDQVLPPQSISLRLANLDEDDADTALVNEVDRNPNDENNDSAPFPRPRTTKRTSLTVEIELREALYRDIERLRGIVAQQSPGLFVRKLDIERLREMSVRSNRISEALARPVHVQQIARDSSISSSNAHVSQPIWAFLNARSGLYGGQEAAYTGMLGEIYVYLLLERQLPQFGYQNWMSTVRTYMGFPPFNAQNFVADFWYNDTRGVLTDLLLGTEQKDKWQGRWPTYHLEVKASSRAASTPFFMSSRQLRHASQMALRNLEEPNEIYVLVRVSDTRSHPKAEIYPDPWRHLYNCDLQLVDDVQMATSL